jgi:hypothetical protein
LWIANLCRHDAAHKGKKIGDRLFTRRLRGVRGSHAHRPPPSVDLGVAPSFALPSAARYDRGETSPRGRESAWRAGSGAIRRMQTSVIYVGMRTFVSWRPPVASLRSDR